MNDKPTICIDCEFVKKIDNIQGPSYMCKHGVESMDFVTGQINTSSMLQYCSNINKGNCPNFRRKK
jgi:hypothetical protein